MTYFKTIARILKIAMGMYSCHLSGDRNAQPPGKLIKSLIIVPRFKKLTVARAAKARKSNIPIDVRILSLGVNFFFVMI